MASPSSITLDPKAPSVEERIASQVAQAPPKVATAPIQAPAPGANPVADTVTISPAAQALARAQAPTQAAAQAPAQAPAPPPAQAPAPAAAQAPAQAAAQAPIQVQVPTVTQVQDLSRQGESVVQIANKLGLSQQDVESYLGPPLV